MCIMQKNNWWCHKLFLIPIIVATFLGLVTTLNMDYQSKVLPGVLEETYATNVEFVLKSYEFPTTSTCKYLKEFTETLDKNSGVAAGLYTLDGKEIYPLNKDSDEDDSHLLPLSLRQNVIDAISNKNEVRVFPAKILQRHLVFKFHYIVKDNYVMVYAIRPDYISKYGLNFSNFYWWILGGMIFNIITYLVTFRIFKRYQSFYDRRITKYHKKRAQLKEHR